MTGYGILIASDLEIYLNLWQNALSWGPWQEFLRKLLLCLFLFRPWVDYCIVILELFLWEMFLTKGYRHEQVILSP
jgi:hypothetical protein